MFTADLTNFYIRTKTKIKNIKCTNTKIGGLDEKYATTYINTYMNYSSIPTTKHKVLKNCLQNIINNKKKLPHVIFMPGVCSK